ncbi:MAG: cytochrome c [Pirellulales bacterium]
MKFFSTLPSGTIFCVFVLLAALSGCRPAERPQFTPSADVLALDDEAADDEERKLWHDLQQKIDKELLKRTGTPQSPISLSDPEANAAQLKLGAEVYATRCQQCHGVNGDGLGVAAGYLSPRPRDYTKGIFKFTSTPYGAKPRRSDLIATLRRGVTGTSMPSFDDLSPEDLSAVVDYVIFLAQRGELQNELVMLAQDEEAIESEYVDESVAGILERWHEAQSQLVMPLTPMPPFTAETVAKGQELFLKQACNKCHGANGRGGSMGGVEIGMDSWGHKAAAADLTSGMFRGGGRPIDIYRRIYSGINGTPMPAFNEVFAKQPDDIWYLVHFIRETGERRRRNLPPLEEPAVPATTPAEEAPANQPAPEPTDATKAAQENVDTPARAASLVLPSHPHW